MKFSFSKILTALFLILIVCSCSKEGTTDAAQAGTNSTGTNGSLSRFTIVDHYLYTVTHNALTTYDISDPLNPVQTNRSTITWDIETIYPFNNNLFIGSRTGLYIYNIDNPSVPVQVGMATHARSCDPVVANDNYAFVTLKSSSSCGTTTQSGLYIHDIRNITQPTLVKTVPLNDPLGLGLSGNTLYVCCNDEGLKVFNISNPEHPSLIRTVTGQQFKDVIPFGNLLICYVSTGIMLYDISNPTEPVGVKLIAN